MSAFRGFSDIDLQEDKEAEKPVHNTQSTNVNLNKKKTNSTPKRSPFRSTQEVRSKPPNETEAVPKEALLSSPPPQSTEETCLEKTTCVENGLADNQEPDLLEGTVNDDNISKLELMELRQKQIEEGNKRKRQLLLQAIADRRQRTAEEANKLCQVQNELKKMDFSVAQEVKTLRKTIEEASLGFLQAQKRYDNAENEFVDAKLNLHKKQERKELLTEHLMTIIQESESRKADKLAELMNQLEIKEDQSCDTEE